MLADFGMPHFLSYLLISIHLCGLIAAVHAVLTVRTAQGALAWGLSLFFMPYLTLLPYIVFGRSRFDAYVKARRKCDEEMRQAMTSLDSKPWLAEAEAARESPLYRRLRALPKLSRLPCLANNQVKLLVNGQDTFAAIFTALSQAQKVALIQFYIVHDDELGKRMHQAMLERAAAGVQVYFLYDGIGSHALPAAYVDSLRAGGVNVSEFPTGGGILDRFQLNFRNHRKIVVVDGITGFVGGHNVGDEYMGKDPKLSPWRDTHVQIHGPVVASLQVSFAQDWFWATHELPKLVLPEHFDAGGVLCQVIPSGPADPQETGSLLFVEAIHAANERIWISTPYFIPDEALDAALRLAVLRGVDVRVMIPAHGDSKVVSAATRLYAFQAMKGGIRVFCYQPGFIHQKAMLIDSGAAIIGSANFDNRSFRLNFEINLLTVDNTFALEVEQMLNDDFKLARELQTADRKSVNVLQQFGMRVARLVSPIL
ncbi:MULTISPECIES: cardiolipin synthase [Pseudomonas]|uniref:Cardiolipin synthase A n=1 Tax=Pseudomonas marincola TaxID=437900 RepID=A0A653E1C6_9PSED|nr:cardiolipin synthase [Pseudomonas marincola]CAE6954483.1 Cardiolipin synthase A [Pseudomonas marincola]